MRCTRCVTTMVRLRVHSSFIPSLNGVTRVDEVKVVVTCPLTVPTSWPYCKVQDSPHWSSMSLQGILENCSLPQSYVVPSKVQLVR